MNRKRRPVMGKYEVVSPDPAGGEGVVVDVDAVDVHDALESFDEVLSDLDFGLAEA